MVEPLQQPLAAVYDHPLWYERAFSWRRVPREVAAIIRFATAWSRRPLAHICELFCGPAVHGRDFCRRGFAFTGIDCNPSMLAHARSCCPQGTFIQADAYALPPLPPCDLLLCLLGSLTPQGPRQVRDHLRHAARVVAPGGIYLLEWAVINGGPALMHDHWQVTGDDYQMSADYSAVPLLAEGLFRERLLLTIAGAAVAGGHLRLQQIHNQWAMDQAFLRQYCSAARQWEWCGSWDGWHGRRPLTDDQVARRPITILRRRGL